MQQKNNFQSWESNCSQSNQNVGFACATRGLSDPPTFQKVGGSAAVLLAFVLHGNTFPRSKKLMFKAGKQILAKVSKMLDLLELVFLHYSRISYSRGCGAAPRPGRPMSVGEYEGPRCPDFPRASQRGNARKLILANAIFWMLLLE